VPAILSYPPVPPSDRVDVVWQGDEFDITIPPRITLRGFVFMLLLTTVAAVCLALAIHPVGAARLVGQKLHRDGGLAGQLTSAAVGTAAAVLVFATLRQFRTWTHVMLRKGTLIFKVPSLISTRVTRVHLGSLATATVGPWKAKPHGFRYLLLHRRNGGVEMLLESGVYAVSDLEIVAAAMREAIARRVAK
jgi:hypothetical protein